MMIKAGADAGVNLLLLSTVTFASVWLDIPWMFVSSAVGGSFIGAALLVYFSRADTWQETTIKVLLGTLSGIVVGAVSVRYLQLTDFEYRFGVFGASGLLSLIMIRSLVKITEVNSSTWLTRIAEYILRTKLRETPPDDKK